VWVNNFSGNSGYRTAAEAESDIASRIPGRIAYSKVRPVTLRTQIR
jgi:hypothetical protein